MKTSEMFTPQERASLLRRSNTLAWLLVSRAWVLTLGILVMVGYYPSVWTVSLAWLLLPGRQLSLAVLMHEAGHGSLFRTQALNTWVGQWLCALPTLGDLPSYAAGHTAHHRLVGTEKDPDLPNYRAYPIPKVSLYRKWRRDLTGQTGLKLLVALATGGASQLSRETRGGRQLLAKQILVHSVFVSILWSLGIAWTWWVWMGAFLTSYMWVVRLRQVGEHAAVPDLYDPDVRNNTRTIDAPFWQRFLVAPNNVNFHMEHHLMAGVPCYNLPRMRALLMAKGHLASVPSVRGYGQLLRMAVAG